MAAQQAPLRLSAVADSSGRAVITVRPRGSQVWIVQQVGTTMSPRRGGATGVINFNGSIVTPFVPTGDAPAGEPYLWLRPGDEMTVEWSGCTAGDRCQATVLYVLGGADA